MPPAKGRIVVSSGTTGPGTGDDHDHSYKKARTSLQNLSIEEHWHFPQVEKKQSSLGRLSFKAMKDSFKKFRRSKALKGIHEGPHDPRDDQLVQNFREMLLKDGLLPEKLDDYHTLLRFLRMRGFNMLKAKDMYLKMLKWRSDQGVDTIEKDFTFEEYEEVKKCYPHGYHEVDRLGRPLYIERIGLVDLNTLLKVTELDRFVKYHIMEQEKTLNLRYPACSVAAKRHVASTTVILDAKEVGRNNFSKPARDLFMEIQKIDSNYYPETLNQLFIVNAGSGFKALWQVLKAFLEPRTAAKIQVLGSKYQSKLVEAIDPSNLPTFLGGTCTCSEDGGCLLKDKGPWNNPEIIDLLQAILDKEQNSSEISAIDEASEDFDSEQKDGSEATSSQGHAYIPGTYQLKGKGNGVTEKDTQTDYINDILPQKILELEAGFKDTKAILQKLLFKQEEIVTQIEQLKDLAFSITEQFIEVEVQSEDSIVWQN